LTLSDRPVVTTLCIGRSTADPERKVSGLSLDRPPEDGAREVGIVAEPLGEQV
jgi:hypothetical protein